MNNFQIKDSLIKLREKNYSKNINSTIDFLLENYDEYEIRLLSSRQGIKIDGNLINLFFMDNIGFRCLNEKDNIYGKFPICKNIESFMNKLYLESFND
jgi:hypothetical protein